MVAERAGLQVVGIARALLAVLALAMVLLRIDNLLGFGVVPRPELWRAQLRDYDHCPLGLKDCPVQPLAF